MISFCSHTSNISSSLISAYTQLHFSPFAPVPELWALLHIKNVSDAAFAVSPSRSVIFIHASYISSSEARIMLPEHVTISPESDAERLPANTSDPVLLLYHAVQ